MRKLRQLFSCLFCLIALFAVNSGSVFAQGARVRADRNTDPDAVNARISSDPNDPDGDHPEARDEWFRSGRRLLGEHAADYLHRAYEQKKAMAGPRANRETSRSSDLVNPESATSNPQQNTANGIPFTGGTYAGTWKSLGPAPITSDPNQDYGAVVGRVTSVAVDQGDTTGNTVYIGAAFGGAWKSTNAANSNPTAVTWTPIIDDQPTLAVGAITVQPGHSNVVLIGTGEPNSSGDSYYGMGILRSTQGGAPDTWTLIRSTGDNAKTFSGLGTSSFAWGAGATANTVVAGIGSTNGTHVGTPIQAGGRGIYYSQDAGATWFYATVRDAPGGPALSEGTVTSLIFNPGTQKFYAAYRFHGFYESTDGVNWIRSGVQNAQPGQPDSTGILTLTNCPTDQSAGIATTCLLYRGQLTVQPTTNDMYVVYVDANNNDMGVYMAAFNSNAGTLGAWTQLRSGPCKDPAQPGVCPAAEIGNPPQPNPIWNNPGIEEIGTVPGQIVQGEYNLWIGAVPTSQGTDLLIGTRNIYRCSANSTNNCSNSGAWLNLTFVYGCNNGNPESEAAPSHMHPDQHGFDLLANSQIMYFGNDGGVYRALHGTSVSNGTCSSQNPFDNLDTNMGSLSEMVSFSQDPTNANILLGGLQDNGSPALLNSTNPTWQVVNGGDGGYNEIDPNNPGNIWYAANTGVSIQQCNTAALNIGITSTLQCTPGTFGLPPYPSNAFNIGPPQVLKDTAEFYMPFTLDPANTANVVLGTCRIWRGPGVGGGNWNSAANDASPIFDSAQFGGNATSCSDGTNIAAATTKIRSLAVGGPAPNGVSQVIYVGLEGGGTATASGGNLGHIFVNTQADTSTGTHGNNSGWVDVSGNVDKGVNGFPPFPISSLAIDSHDGSGKTAYVTVEGFQGTQGTGHVFATTSAGQSWNDITSNLPDIPTDSIAVDPDDPNVLYVGTDVGAFITFDGGASWDILGAGLPNVPVTKIRVFGTNASGTKLLRVSTYGRGMWQFTLPVPPAADLSPAALSFGNQLVKLTSPLQTATFTNNSSAAITITSVSLTTGTDFNVQSSNCPISPATLAPLAKCQVQISFTPHASGQSNGTLVVANTAGNLQVALSGNGVLSALSVAPASLSFTGSAQNPTVAQTLTVTNSAPGSVNITSITISGTGFSQNGGTCRVGFSGASCAIPVVFTAPVPQTPSNSPVVVNGTVVVMDSTGNSQTVSLTGTGTDFSIAAGTSTNSQTVTAGQPATYNLNLSGTTGFSGTVTLTCTSGVPTAASCMFSPNSVSLTGTTVSAVTLTITTTAHSASQPSPTIGFLRGPKGLVGIQWTLLTIAALCVLLGQKPRRTWSKAFSIIAILGTVILIPACGGGSGATTNSSQVVTTGTPAGSYSVVVSATSGNRAEALPLTLKVN